VEAPITGNSVHQGLSKMNNFSGWVSKKQYGDVNANPFSNIFCFFISGWHIKYSSKNYQIQIHKERKNLF
jgi:hypothetical protein